MISFQKRIYLKRDRQVTKMKQYKITKIIWAKNYSTALKNERDAEIVEICLNEALDKPNTTIGFLH